MGRTKLTNDSEGSEWLLMAGVWLILFLVLRSMWLARHRWFKGDELFITKFLEETLDAIENVDDIEINSFP